MNKLAIINAIAKKLDCTKAQAKEHLEAFVEVTSEALAEGDMVNLNPAFGSFKIKHREERNGRNPSTGEAMTIPAKNVIAFTASSALNKQVNQ
mgnify:CR=1 FL=1|tara:strand:+ start:1154 stop:1432 length:279 start_codon:yes stop_codon:yes gene_type:complete